MPSNGGSGESTSTQSPRKPSSQKAERPPVLKKFKTVAPDDPRATPDFPGPLFPAVRRVTSLPPSSDRRTSVDTDASADSQGNVAASCLNNVDVVSSLSDRDWMYPSFLGPHAARNRVVTVKPVSRPPVRVGGERLVERVQRLVVDEKQQSNTPANKEEVKIAASTTTVTERSSVSSSSSRRIRGMKMKRYFIFFLIIFSCIYPLTYVSHLRNKVARLESLMAALLKPFGFRGHLWLTLEIMLIVLELGPGLSVSISSGGMLIFAMMLGLVSDAISEKVDSLRKGKSEVVTPPSRPGRKPSRKCYSDH